MKRTQIYLRRDEVALLARAAMTTGASNSELIRRAIRRTYGELGTADRLAALDASAGAWRDRDFTGEAYVDRIRGDFNDRLKQLGLY